MMGHAPNAAGHAPNAAGHAPNVETKVFIIMLRENKLRFYFRGEYFFICQEFWLDNMTFSVHKKDIHPCVSFFYPIHISLKQMCDFLFYILIITNLARIRSGDTLHMQIWDTHLTQIFTRYKIELNYDHLDKWTEQIWAKLTLT